MEILEVEAAEEDMVEAMVVINLSYNNRVAKSINK